MKSGYTMTTISIEDHGVSPAMHQQASALHLVGSAAQTDQNHHRSLSTTSDTSELSIEEKQSLYEQRHHQVIL